MPSKDRLTGFSKRQSSSATPKAVDKPTPRKQRDPGDAPDGYDQDCWTLAIRFQEYAWHNKIRMAQGLPVIHNVIRDLVDGYNIRSQVFHQVVEPCTRRFKDGWVDKCWYHWPPHRTADQVARDLRWPEMVEIIMAEFWSRYQNDHCLAHFGDYFEEYGQKCLDHWRSLRILASLDEAAKTYEPSYRSERANAMIRAGKEG